MGKELFIVKSTELSRFRGVCCPSFFEDPIKMFGCPMPEILGTMKVGCLGTPPSAGGWSTIGYEVWCLLLFSSSMD